MPVPGGSSYSILTLVPKGLVRPVEDKSSAVPAYLDPLPTFCPSPTASRSSLPAVSSLPLRQLSFQTPSA